MAVPIAARRALPQYRLFRNPRVSYTYSTYRPSPAPPRLPKEEQDLFEQLQNQSTGAFSTPRITPQVNQSPADQTSAATAIDTSTLRAQINQSPQSEEPKLSFDPRIKDKEGEELHPNMRRGAPPEFDGEINPKTGEVGGPKNEPLRWGHGGDWSYNGRVTDF